MRFYLKVFFSVFIFFFIFPEIGLNSYSFAQTCGGTFSCNRIQNTCSWSITNEPCTCGSPQNLIDGSCGSASSSCAPGSDGPWSCGGGSSCPAADGLCDPLCGIASYGCSLSGGGGGEVCGNGTCAGGETCSSCPGDCGTCNPCGGGGYSSCLGGYCCENDGFPVCTSGGCCPSGYAYVCNGVCSASPCTTTDTPTPGLTTTPGATNTPAPTTAPPATPIPTSPTGCGLGELECGGSTGICCGAGSHCDHNGSIWQCIADPGGPIGCTVGGETGSCYTNSPQPTEGEVCLEFGVSGASGTYHVLGSCSGGGLGGGVSGTCAVCVIPPTPTSPPPTYSISGKVYIESNGIPGQQCSGPCNNAAGDELNYSGARVRAGSGFSNSSNSNTSGNYTISNLEAWTYTPYIYPVPSGFGILTSPGAVIVGPDATNKNFALGPSAACTVNDYTVTGEVYLDDGGNYCTSGSSVAGGISVELIDGATSTTVDTDTSGLGGVFSVTDSNTNVCDEKHLILGKRIRAFKIGVGPWQTSVGFSGQDYGPFSYSGTSNAISFCLESTTPWFQVTTGDVRFNALVNKIPVTNTQTTASSATYPGILFSSKAGLVLNGKNASAKNWQVSQEYYFNKKFVSGKGGMAYSFYTAKAAVLGVLIQDIPDTSGLNGLPSGIYKVPSGTIINNNP